jgi:hypothetical protein
VEKMEERDKYVHSSMPWCTDERFPQPALAGETRLDWEGVATSAAARLQHGFWCIYDWEGGESISS